ncbi:MAG: fused response regulator/phosphatase [Planctomycetales bacterium]|nr:fused response regulator/phosphatase [Planctomycetales bacterium]
MQASSGLVSKTVSRKAVVLLVDDQLIVGAAVREMLAEQSDIEFHFCPDPFEALDKAIALNPTVILQDLVMPDIDGLSLVRFYRACHATRNTPIVVLSATEDPVVKANAFSLGANDYVVKLPDKLELIARVRYHSQAFVNLLERNAAFAALEVSENRMAHEMETGARYVASLIPAPIETPIKIDWRFIPSAELGGDSMGYFPLDEKRFAFFMLDVTGHGLASALLGVSVCNVLRSRAVAGADLANPAQVLAALNRSFPMEEQEGRTFTMWYGVFEHETRKLTWSGGGHPSVLLFRGGAGAPIELESQNPGVGMFELDEFEQQEMVIPPNSRLFLFSDGAFEIHKQDGGMWTFREFMQFISQSGDTADYILDRLIHYVRNLKGGTVLDDDFTIMDLRV